MKCPLWIRPTLLVVALCLWGNGRQCQAYNNRARCSFQHPAFRHHETDTSLSRRHGWTASYKRRPRKPSLFATPAVSSSALNDYQSDDSKFGRGEMHLSAMLDEGDVVVYQAGNWLVDGVRVGSDDIPPSLHYARVETIQIVWTHNCEHGVIRGLALNKGDDAKFFCGEDFVEFGPEQLLARLAAAWNSDYTECTILASLDMDRVTQE